MTSALQNRLVGTIIVVALVVIFVPEFLDGEKVTSQQTFVEVPEVTQIVEVQSARPIDTSIIRKELDRPTKLTDEQPVDVNTLEEDTGNTSTQELTQTDNGDSDNVSKQDVNQDASQSPINVTPEPSEQKQTVKTVNLDDIKLDDTGWVVQLGSFQHEKNVKSLLKTLNDAGYRVYTRPITNSAGISLTKVFVGPELDKQKLENALPHLLELTKLKGKITPFEVSAN